MFTLRSVVIVQGCMHMFKFIKWFTLNMCSLSRVDVTLIKLFFKVTKLDIR